MAWEMKYQPNVVLDFDGVIHSYGERLAGRRRCTRPARAAH